MLPYASVIVPTHDRLGTLAGAIASIRRQSVESIEILIIGDGPTPEVAATAEALARQDHRIRFLTFDKSPGDGGRNCNRGVHEAQSERIFYSDDDDVWLPHHVETIGPHLDHSHIVDTLPVSVGAVAIGHTQFHGTIVNSGNARTRSLLADDKLKLIFDTHVAHRKSSYIDLGNPWIAPQGYSVCHMLGAFASAGHIRWTTLPNLTALSLHGTARMTATPDERHREIELLLDQSRAWTSDDMFARTDFTWHMLRTLCAVPPLAEDTVATYFARLGVEWDEFEGRAGSSVVSLAVPLLERHRRAIELVFGSFQGRAPSLDNQPEAIQEFGEFLRHMLDRVLSSFVSVDFALVVLQPFGWERALELVEQIQDRKSEPEPLFALLTARLLLICGRTIPARAVADRLCQENQLSDHELTRLLVCIDLAAGHADVAIQRLERAWLHAPKFFEIGLQLAQTLIAVDRKDRAMAVCKALDNQIPGHPTLVSISHSARR